MINHSEAIKKEALEYFNKNRLLDPVVAFSFLKANFLTLFGDKFKEYSFCYLERVIDVNISECLDKGIVYVVFRFAK